MRILLTSPDHWNYPLPYHIAPQRIARALTRAGHELFNIDLYEEVWGVPPHPPNQVFQTPWGPSVHSLGSAAPSRPDLIRDYLNQIEAAINEFKPDLIYFLGHLGAGDIPLAQKAGIPFGLHRADPYWKPEHLPRPSNLKFHARADFMTFNEGQAWNYFKQNGLGDKAWLLNHAIDPYLAPTLQEVQRTEKRYLCTTVMGGEDPPRISELIEKYYMATDAFPDQLFIGAGGIGKSFRWKLDELRRKVPNDQSQPHTPEETVYHGRAFNMTKLFHYYCDNFPSKTNYHLLCHKAVHQLYSEGLYAFTPWGDYLRTGILGEYNTKTFGTKTFEMGGSGAAMLSCHIADIEEVVIDGKTGFITHSTKETEEAFQYAIDNPDAVRKMGEEAWRDIHKRHSWDVRYREVLVPIFKDIGVM